MNLTQDGKAQMVCFLPQTPNGKAIMGIPGGGYSMLSNTHEGTLAHEWLNKQGIAYFVVNYRLPNGDRTIPMGDVEKGIRIVRDFSTQNAVKKGETPPAIIIMSTDDNLVPPITNGLEYYKAMKEAGNECALMIYPNGGHGYGFGPWFKYHDEMLATLGKWLDAR